MRRVFSIISLVIAGVLFGTCVYLHILEASTTKAQAHILEQWAAVAVNGGVGFALVGSLLFLKPPTRHWH